MNCTRRNFLIGGSASVFLTGINFSSTALEKNKKNLVIISLRGGMDGLTAIPVIGDKNLIKKRKKLIVEETLKLNSDFALHPKLHTFHDLWQTIRQRLFMPQAFRIQEGLILTVKI